MQIGREHPGDVDAVRRVHLAAFDTALEADLVDALREQAQPLVSLVAGDATGIVGHILFSPVTLAIDPAVPLMGLAPMAVLPGLQRRGIGSALVRAGLEACAGLGAAGVVVLGHPAFYPRFGFAPASRFGLTSEYDVPDDVFLALALRPGALAGRSGRVRYHPAFAIAS
jgi:putative acetyltransferase